MDMPPETTNGGLKLDFKLNVLSIANFVALIGILATALSTWYGLASQVTIATADIASIKQQIAGISVERAKEMEGLRAKDEVIVDAMRLNQDKVNQKLFEIDAKVQILQNSTLRVEQSLDKIIKQGGG